MRSVKERLEDAGYEDVRIFDYPQYENAFLGVTGRNQAVYSYDGIVDYLRGNMEMTEEQAMEYADYNVIGSIGYRDDDPIVIYEVPE